MFYWISLAVVATFTLAVNGNSGYYGVPTYPVYPPVQVPSYPTQGVYVKGNYGATQAASLASPKVNVQNIYRKPEQKDNSGVQGFDATLNQFPFQVSIRINRQHTCGGAIISPIAILTTASCVHKVPRDKITVLSGTIDRERGGLQSRIRSYEIHPNYNEKTKVFDVAIVFLVSNLKLNATTNVAKLPKQNEEFLAHSLVTISGWGGETGGRSYAQKLKYVHVGLMDHSVCASHFHVTNTMICAGELVGRRLSCPGDAGGPLTKGDLLVGLLSWGFGCGAEGKPTVFTYVAGVRDWIKKMAWV